MDTQQEGVLETTQITMPDFNKKQEIVSFFDKNESFVFVYKKTEKLATALYMVTNLFSDTEPMKWSLRTKVSDLLSFTLKYKSITDSQQPDFVDSIKTCVLEIVSLLEIASHTGMVSTMNFTIIKQEFLNLITALDKTENIHSVLPRSFFDTPATPTPGANNEISTYISRIQSNVGKMASIEPKDKVSGSPEQHMFVRTNRQNMILQLLKKKGEITIKDAGMVIKNCSEKTIQRELATLISLGVLKKTGERRWSKYSLAS